MVYAQPSTCPRKWHTLTPSGLWHIDRSPNLDLETKPNNNKKKWICKIVDFAVPADHRIELKECEKKDKYLDLARELKKTMKHAGDNYADCDWCIWYSNYNNNLSKRQEDLEVGRRVETIQTTASLRTARILRRVLEFWVKDYQLTLMWKTLKE